VLARRFTIVHLLLLRTWHEAAIGRYTIECDPRYMAGAGADHKR